jgi:hypothetical protein
MKIAQLSIFFAGLSIDNWAGKAKNKYYHRCFMESDEKSN